VAPSNLEYRQPKLNSYSPLVRYIYVSIALLLNFKMHWNNMEWCVGFISVESLRWEEDSSTCIVTRTFKNVTRQNLLPLANFSRSNSPKNTGIVQFFVYNFEYTSMSTQTAISLYFLTDLTNRTPFARDLSHHFDFLFKFEIRQVQLDWRHFQST